MIGFIYLVTNTINGHQYVGQTTKLQKRWAEHRRAEKPKSLLSRAILKYGAEAFRFEVLCECTSHAEMDELELYYTAKLGTLAPNGYNLTAGSVRGIVSEETRQRMREARHRHYEQPGARERASDAAKRRYVSEEARETTRSAIARMWRRLTGSDRQERTAHLNNPDAVAKREETKRQRHGKTYQLLSPEGEIVTVTNLEAFCRASGLSCSMMRRVCSGRAKEHRGWKAVQ